VRVNVQLVHCCGQFTHAEPVETVPVAQLAALNVQTPLAESVFPVAHWSQTVAPVGVCRQTAQAGGHCWHVSAVTEKNCPLLQVLGVHVPADAL
jgi:hypothetical protein